VKTVQGARDVQEEVDGEENLDPDISSLALYTFLNTFNNKFELMS
jgi:hypothetical protein